MTRMSTWALAAVTLVLLTAGVIVAACRLSVAEDDATARPGEDSQSVARTAKDNAKVEQQEERISIEVKADGTYLVNGNVLDAAGLDKRLGEIASAGRDVYIAVRADTDVAQGPIEVLFGLLEKHGLGMREFSQRVKGREQ